MDASRQSSVPPVFCVLLNWNGASDTIACLDSLAPQNYPNLHVLVVDNASTDDSVTRIRAAHPGIELILSPVNGGFAAGCNIGTRAALERGADFVWLLNNDTVAPPDTLTRLVRTATDQPKAGIVGSVLYYLHDPTRVQAWGGGSIVRWLGYTTHATSPVPQGPDSFLTFASVLLRRQMLLDAGLLDESYFMYYEDVDLCFRARQAGWQLAVAADTAILHREGGSDRPGMSLRTARTVTRSGLLFLSRYGQVPTLAITLYALSRLGKRLLRLDLAGARAVAQGIGDYLRNSR